MNCERPYREAARRCPFEKLEDRYALSVTFVEYGPAFGGDARHSVEFGDLDGDNDIDAFVLRFSEPNEVWLNDGSGNFTNSGQRMGDIYSKAAALGDLDGDGDLDAVVVNSRDSLRDDEPDRVWLNDGSANFTDSGQNLDLVDDSFEHDVALGDMDADNDFDIVIAGSSLGLFNGSKLWINDGRGVFTKRPLDVEITDPNPFWFVAAVDNPSFSLVALGDLNDDQHVDIVADLIHGTSILHNLGNGTFDGGQSGSGELLVLDPVSGHWFGDPPRSISIGDVDLDGDLDLVLGLNDTANISLAATEPFVWINNGEGNFAAGDTTSASWFTTVLGDLEGDGDLDAVVVKYKGFIFQSDLDFEFEVWLNDGKGNFDESAAPLGGDALRSSSPQPTASLADVDNDGDLDVFVRGRMWLTHAGDRVFTPGDANQDSRFDQLDIVQVMQAAKYRTGEPATFEEGDWDGNGVFNQKDIIAALQTGMYLQASAAEFDAAFAEG